MPNNMQQTISIDWNQTYLDYALLSKSHIEISHWCHNPRAVFLNHTLGKKNKHKKPRWLIIKPATQTNLIFKTAPLISSWQEPSMGGVGRKYRSSNGESSPVLSASTQHTIPAHVPSKLVIQSLRQKTKSSGIYSTLWPNLVRSYLHYISINILSI